MLGHPRSYTRSLYAAVAFSGMLVLPHESLRSARSTVPTVRIGAQEWMRENLAVTRFRNGDPIPTVSDSSDWVRAGALRLPAWVAYDNSPTNEVRYGLLYNHYAVTDPRGICPVGFRVPNSADWDALERTLAASRAATRLKTTSGWANDGNGIDDVGFGGLPGGFRTQNGVFFLESRVGYWWTDDRRDVSAPTAWSIIFFDYADTIFRIEYPRAIGQSVRCLRDA